MEIAESSYAALLATVERVEKKTAYANIILFASGVAQED